MTWDPRQRLVTFVHRAGCVCSGENAHFFSQVLETWVRGGPFRIAVDATGAEAITKEWRTVWATWFRAFRRQARIAIYGATKAGRLVITLWAFLASVDVRFFETEAQALAWLDATPPASSPATPRAAS